MGDDRRLRRVGETMRDLLAVTLARHIEDPLLKSCSITEVTVTEDLSLATVKVRLLVGGDVPGQRKQLLRRLGGAAGRLRRLVSPALQLRRAPEFRFVYDDGIEAHQRVEELLAEIARDPKADGDV